MNAEFESSEKEFTDYFHNKGLFDIQDLVKMYVLKQNDIVLGYVTIVMAHLKNEPTPQIKSKEINGNIPSLLISHLAVHKNYLRQKVGTIKLNEVFVSVVPKLTKLAGCRYVMLNPRDDLGVHVFYKKYVSLILNCVPSCISLC